MDCGNSVSGADYNAGGSYQVFWQRLDNGWQPDCVALCVISCSDAIDNHLRLHVEKVRGCDC